MKLYKHILWSSLLEELRSYYVGDDTKALADEIGIPERTLLRHLKGETTPSAQVAARIALMALEFRCGLVEAVDNITGGTR